MTSCPTPGYLPRIQFQNPAISDYEFGWDSCTAYAAGMAGDFDTCGNKVLSGQRVRQLTDEPIPDEDSPGLNLRQIDDALNRYGIDLETRYRLPWSDFVRKIEKGEGAVLQMDTGPFLGTRFQSTAGAINHAIFVPPGWGAMDPAADGRYDYHRYDGSPYPREMLKRAAGRLTLTVVRGTKVRLGYGYTYAAFTRDRRATWMWEIDPLPGQDTRQFAIFEVRESDRTIVRTHLTGTKGTNPQPCTPPRLYRDPARDRSTSLVQMLDGHYQGAFVSARFADEEP